VRRLFLNFIDKTTGYCITATHHVILHFSPGNFKPKATWLLFPTHPTFHCFPDWR
jgi:hypothetical protein